MKELYIIYEIRHCYYLNSSDELNEYRNYLPLYEFDAEDKALKRMESLICECKPYLEEDEGNAVGYVCTEYQLINESMNVEKVMKVKTVSDYDKGLDRKFFEELLLKLKNSKVIFHNWFPYPNALELASLQNL